MRQRHSAIGLALVLLSIFTSDGGSARAIDPYLLVMGEQTRAEQSDPPGEALHLERKVEHVDGCRCGDEQSHQHHCNGAEARRMALLRRRQESACTLALKVMVR